MAEHFLDRADVVICMKKMRGKGMAEGVGRHTLRESCFSNRLVQLRCTSLSLK
jgi:hypothetical protein